jgi:hypothetical protein
METKMKTQNEEKCVLCNLEYKRVLIHQFTDYYICYKCVLQLSKQIDTIFSESKDYETSEAVGRSLSFIGQEHKALEYIIHLTYQKFTIKGNSIIMLC